jgi:hypothetical protein
VVQPEEAEERQITVDGYKTPKAKYTAELR